MNWSFKLSVSQLFFQSVFQCMSLREHLSVCLSENISMFVSQSTFLCLSLKVNLSVCLSEYISPTMSLRLSLRGHLSVCLQSTTLSLSLSHFFSLSF